MRWRWSSMWSGGGEVWAGGGTAVAGGGECCAARERGAAGRVLLAPGTVMGAAEIALAAACGRGVAVRKRPKVAIVATGDELVELARRRRRSRFATRTAMRWRRWWRRRAGGAAAGDCAGHAGGLCGSGLPRGGVRICCCCRAGFRMGKYDLVEEVLAEFGAEFFFTGVKMQPGRPVVFGRLPESKMGESGVDLLLWAAGESGLDAGDVSLLCRADAAGDVRRGCARAEVCAGDAGGRCAREGGIDAAAAGALNMI
jgi:hypothetical protein